MIWRASDNILPARVARGEGDRGTRWRGYRPKSPSTTLRVVPLPIACGDREDRMA